MINRHYNQGTPPFMAIEALISDKKGFEHLPRHDLESILYVILFICTFTIGPSQPRPDFKTTEKLKMKAWFTTETITTIGSRKMLDMSQPERSIIPGFTPYWKDFAPFALELLNLCFPPTYSSALPNKLTYGGMLAILDRACNTVKESCPEMPEDDDIRLTENLKRSESPEPNTTRRTRRKLEKVY
jgi:hypothetical protein